MAGIHARTKRWGARTPGAKERGEEQVAETAIYGIWLIYPDMDGKDTHQELVYLRVIQDGETLAVGPAIRLYY